MILIEIVFHSAQTESRCCYRACWLTRKVSATLTGTEPSLIVINQTCHHILFHVKMAAVKKVGDGEKEGKSCLVFNSVHIPVNN